MAFGRKRSSNGSRDSSGQRFPTCRRSLSSLVMTPGRSPPRCSSGWSGVGKAAAFLRRSWRGSLVLPQRRCGCGRRVGAARRGRFWQNCPPPRVEPGALHELRRGTSALIPQETTHSTETDSGALQRERVSTRTPERRRRVGQNFSRKRKRLMLNYRS